MTLKPLLDLLLPEFAPALIGDGARAALETAARVMAPIPHVAIECRLAVDQAQVDIQQQLRRHTDDARLLSRHLAGFAGAGETPVRLSRFCDAWGARTPRSRALRKCFWNTTCRAMDVRRRFRHLFLPAARRTVGTRRARRSRSSTMDILPTRSRDASTLRRPAEPGSVISVCCSIVWANPTRVNVKGMRPHALRAFLDGIGWNGDRDAAEALFDWALNHVDRVTLALDIGNGAVLPRLGLECLLKRQPAVERRWSALLEALERQGLCDGDKRAAVLAAPGVTAPMLAGTALAAPMDRPVAGGACRSVRRSRKGALLHQADAGVRRQPGGQGLFRRAGRLAGAGAGKSPRAVARAPRTDRRQRAGALNRGDDGAGERRAFRAARAERPVARLPTVQRRKQRVGECVHRDRACRGLRPPRVPRRHRCDVAPCQATAAGWRLGGYDNASVSDADSTAWVLRLHARFGGLEGDSAARAAAFCPRMRSRAASRPIAKRPISASSRSSRRDMRGRGLETGALLRHGGRGALRGLGCPAVSRRGAGRGWELAEAIGGATALSHGALFRSVGE